MIFMKEMFNRKGDSTVNKQGGWVIYSHEETVEKNVKCQLEYWLYVSR